MAVPVMLCAHTITCLSLFCVMLCANPHRDVCVTIIKDAILVTPKGSDIKAKVVLADVKACSVSA